MTKEEAKSKLDALVEARVEAGIAQLKNELAKARHDRITWFYAGYEAGMKDNPKELNPFDKPFTLDQRKTRAAATYAIQTNKTDTRPQT